MDKIKVMKLKDNARIPTYGSLEAAGADLYACMEHDVEIAPGQSAFIPTGLAMEIPKGFAGLVYARSGLACTITYISIYQQIFSLIFLPVFSLIQRIKKQLPS